MTITALDHLPLAPSARIHIYRPDDLSSTFHVCSDLLWPAGMLPALEALRENNGSSDVACNGQKRRRLGSPICSSSMAHRALQQALDEGYLFVFGPPDDELSNIGTIQDGLRQFRFFQERQRCRSIDWPWPALIFLCEQINLRHCGIRPDGSL